MEHTEKLLDAVFLYPKGGVEMKHKIDFEFYPIPKAVSQTFCMDTPEDELANDLYNLLVRRINYKDEPNIVPIEVGGKGKRYVEFECKKGQCVSSIRKLAERFRCDRKMIEKCIADLEMERFIIADVIPKQGVLFTLRDYADSDTRVDAELQKNMHLLQSHEKSHEKKPRKTLVNQGIEHDSEPPKKATKVSQNKDSIIINRDTRIENNTGIYNGDTGEVESVPNSQTVTGSRAKDQMSQNEFAPIPELYGNFLAMSYVRRRKLTEDEQYKLADLISESGGGMLDYDELIRQIRG